MGSSFNPQGKLALNDRFIPFMKGENIYPFNVEISISGVCHETCKTCFYKDGQTGSFFSQEMFNNFFNYSSYVSAVTWTGGGEPTENDLFPEFTHAIYNSGKKQGLFTNLGKPLNITPMDFEWIRVTCTPRNMRKDEGLSHIRSGKKVGLCINYTGSTDDTFVDNCISVCYKYDFDYIQIRPALEKGGQQSNVIIDKDKFSRHSKVLITDYKFEGQSEEKSYSQCEGFNFVPFIWEDGLVTVCAYHRVEPYVLGYLKEETFLDIVHKIWVKRSVPVSNSCQVCCKNHEINKMLYASKLITDIEFI